MKLIQILLTGLLLSNFSGYAQNVASTSTLTSGGLEAGTNGTENTFYGYKAGKSNTTGSGNTFIGQSGSQNTIGSNNVFNGFKAGETNISGNHNVFIGNSAGNVNNGNNNVFVGAQSGSVENDGSGNTFLGFGAGRESNGSGNIFIGTYAGFGVSSNNKLYIDLIETDTPLIWGDFALDQLKLNGKVGIGNGFANFPTTAGAVNVSNYNLFVKGGILTEEIRVNLQSNWADYVFSPSYKLKTLDEVESYITKNGHLENVPSAKKVKEEGIELGEMVKIQQEKIEELTLYLIQQNKEIKELRENLKSLKN